MNTLERVKEIRDAKGLSSYAFSKSIGVDSGNFSRTIKGNGNFSEYVLMKIASTFGVSLDWLKTGEGEMYDTTPKPMSAQEMMQVTNKYGMHVVGDNAVQNNGSGSTSASMEAEIAALKARLEEKDKQIEMLMEIIKNR